MPDQPGYFAEIIHNIADVSADMWNRCAGDNPFLQHAFLLALEQSGCASPETGWQPFHIQIKQDGSDTVAGYMPLYVKSHSAGEYVFDHAWANAFEHAGGRYYPKMQSSVPFTPVTSGRLLLAPDTVDTAGARRALLQAVCTTAQQHNLSSAHITFMHADEAKDAEKEGFLLRADQQFHWQNNNYQNFDAFLAQLSSRKRKQIKKERRTVVSSEIDIEILEGKQIQAEHWDVFYTFYLDTSARKWGQPYLNREFFSLIGETMPDNIILMLCKKGERYIAGALNFKSDDTLYGRYWGCNEDHPCLHFETCYYQAIDYAIAHGLKSVEAGAQGPHKLARGYTPTLTYSAHWINDPGFRSAVAQFLKSERAGIDAEVEYLRERSPFKK